MLSELRDGGVLDGYRIVRIGGDHRVPTAVVLCGGKERLEICKYSVIDLDCVRIGMEIRNRGVAEVRREHEGIANGGNRYGRWGCG